MYFCSGNLYSDNFNNNDMKKLIVFASVIGFLASCSDAGKSNAHAEFYVRGNCGMCKERIDKTVAALPGVAKADWNVESKSIIVDYDSTKVSSMEIEKAVAATGHATKSVVMDSTAHDKLPMCCKAQSGHSHDDHEGHSH